MESKELRQFILIVVVLLVAAGVYVSIWAGNRANEIRGPTEMILDAQGSLWISVNRDLYRISRSGDIIRTIESGGEQILERGIQALVLDESGNVWVGYGKDAKIHRYDPRLGHLIKEYSASPPSPGEFPSDVFKFVVDPQSNGLFVADTRNHHIRYYDASGTYQRRFGEQGEDPDQFHFPNGIRFGPDGLLYISDTNNHRIGVFDRSGVHRFSISATEDKPSSEMEWPTQFAFTPDGSILVINKGPGLIGGEIAKLDPKTGLIETMDLPFGTDPMNILVTGDEFWVSDEAQMQILRYTLAGERLDNFEAGQLRDLLDELEFQRSYFESRMATSQLGLVLLLLLLLVLLVIERRQKAKEIDLQDPLAGHMELRPLPTKVFSLRKKLKFAGYLIASIVGLMLFVVALTLLPLLLMEEEQRETFSALFKIALYPLMACHLGIVFLIFSVAVRDGALHQTYGKSAIKVLAKQRSHLSRMLAPDETVHLVATPRLLGRGLLTILLGPWASDISLLVVTGKRILLLTTDLFASGLRRAQEIAYPTIEKHILTPPMKVHRWMERWLGSGFLSLKFKEERRFLEFQFLDSDIAEAVGDEISARTGAAADGESFPGPRKICLKCFHPVAPHLSACPSCGHAERPAWIPAMVSLVYPGLGQFLNHNLFRGVILVTVFTVIFAGEVNLLYIAATGTAEVKPQHLFELLVWHGTLAIIGALDAFLSARR